MKKQHGMILKVVCLLVDRIPAHSSCAVAKLKRSGYETFPYPPFSFNLAHLTPRDNSADKRRIGYGFTRSIEKDQNSVLFIIYIQTLGMMKGNSTVILE
ncbi:hypothetical protein TNCV_733531 [Trichonephila clavipes]|nr:hypothetical protein TNCV_733531 [Trichonephila clavipes]